MQVILPSNQTLVVEHAVLVQHPPTVHWIGAEQAADMVELLPQASSVMDWVAWVEASGGRWANDQELAEI